MVPVPSNSTATWSDHGISGLVCTPANASSIALFFLVNYAAHCVTVKLFPAETPKEIAIAIASALFFPSSGLSRAMDAIRRRTRLRKLSSIEKAAQAGALCMVVRTPEWQPRKGDIIRNIRSRSSLSKTNRPNALSAQPTLEGNSTNTNQDPIATNYNLSTKRTVLCSKIFTPPWTKEFEFSCEPFESILRRKCKIHGVYRLPEGYEFAYIPHDAILSPSGINRSSSEAHINLVTSNSLMKTCLALLQTGYAMFSVYRARGDQIDLYGYAAPGLSVIQYIIMSVLNLIAQAVSDDYPMFYMVSSAEMDEAIRRGGIFQGAVARLEPWDGGIDELEKELCISTNSGPWIVDRNTGLGGWSLRSQHPDTTPNFHQIETKVASSGSHNIYIPTCTKFQRKGQNQETQLRLADWSPHSTAIRRILHDTWRRYSFLAPLACSFISFSLLGGLSKFHSGTHSASIERGFMISWLITGMLCGFLITEYLSPIELMDYKFRRIKKAVKAATKEAYGRAGGGRTMVADRRFRTVHGLGARRCIPEWLKIAVGSTVSTLMVYSFRVMTLLVILVPAVGGFVTVGKIMLEYGDCTRVK
ncbi:hypothetical protein GQ44DRAFT_826426 [Phaeosphaeriaceae sp. PMI808]|nr:hypothetical protein GQ44DRAFT_826426 [Phaeosphaeriaceae sp. PMI808]